MTRWFKWFTILSLDAPTVAVVWKWMFAHTAGTQPDWARSAIVFAAVWLGYAGDRWLDSTFAHHPVGLRHYWYQSKRWLVLGIWLPILIAAVVFSWVILDASELAKGFTLAGAALVYALFAQRGRRLPFYGQIKSLLIAVLVAASAALYAVPQGDFAFLVSPVGLLAIGLFYINCQYVRLWDNRPGAHSNTIITLSILLLVAAIVVSFTLPSTVSVGASVCLSLCGLWTLDYKREKTNPEVTRSLADWCLLSPLLMLLLA